MKQRLILGAAFMQWLECQGVLPPDRPVRRVIIDAVFDEPVTIYWEELGSTALTPAEGAPEALLQAGLKKLP